MLDKIKELCKARGVKFTKSREVIAKVVSDSNDHPDVDEVWRRASKIDSNIGIATVYRSLKLFEEAGIKVEVIHCALENIPADIQLVVTHKDLAARAKAKAPNAELVTIENFVGAPEYDQLVEKLK